ncbi:hypothetical protein [Ornithinimicrobium pratense]|uniref:ATP/GTP-binding protein n=1 Tax=Ornithinimicrobium pratense TaxID=2593973 RepID=A0A5J6V3X2_9MICO|nr:hypothetical protein [Ornithinimicrobium pratense]QFG67842.1 hypothetical protein FY030_03085 [Ornithinimicrobium pratense]
MGRSNRPRRHGRPRKGVAGGGLPPSVQRGGVGEVRYAGQLWLVRQVRPNDSGRSYLCPGCQQEVSAGTAHTVVWPAESMRELENRRHWHTVCWSARERRRPGGSFA